MIGDRFIRQTPSTQVTVGALGVEVGSPLEGGGSHFGQVRRAAWRTLTRHLRDPRAAVTPVSA